MEEKYSFPKVAWLSLTERCNNRCVWCYEKCNEAKSEVFMSCDIVCQGPRFLDNHLKMFK